MNLVEDIALAVDKMFYQAHRSYHAKTIPSDQLDADWTCALLDLRSTVDRLVRPTYKDYDPENAEDAEDRRDDVDFLVEQVEQMCGDEVSMEVDGFGFRSIGIFVWLYRAILYLNHPDKPDSECPWSSSDSGYEDFPERGVGGSPM